ncbi:unnamed protein product [Adineta steineri]|uniref:Uncharacterized protein n=1 Tax=Adineta steineri TaxID=433720 RepID=A0A819WHW2_9BILA|nr:unnamed protein product [Adineta steineri]CAF4124738.1 unnamed protein product [Adineta steineri]
MNDNEKYYRKELVTYALHDCLSMHTILINMKIKKYNLNFQMKNKIPYELIESISLSNDYDDEISFSQLIPSVERRKTYDTWITNEHEHIR